jgi:anti-sigma B factor antagonist
MAPRPDRPSVPVMEIERIECGLALRGELDAATAEQLEAVVQEALLGSSGAFLVDLSGLEFMDSGGVNALLRTRALLGREERALAVICPPGPARRVLEVIGVADLFTLFATLEDARAALMRPH